MAQQLGLQMLSQAVHDKGPRLHLVRDIVTGTLKLGIQLDSAGDVGVVISFPEDLLTSHFLDAERHKIALLEAIHADVTRQMAIIALNHKEKPGA